MLTPVLWVRMGRASVITLVSWLHNSVFTLAAHCMRPCSVEAQHGSRPDMMCVCVCVKSLVLDFIFDHIHLQVNWNFSRWLNQTKVLIWVGGWGMLSLIISIMQLKFKKKKKERKKVHCAAGSEFGFGKDSSYFRMWLVQSPQKKFIFVECLLSDGSNKM